MVSPVSTPMLEGMLHKIYISVREPASLSNSVFFTCRPEGLVSGFNKFLNTLDITFRRDPTN